ncbi:unnamed product [Ostreococcus tauri]|uniref:Unnamed product n=1 Tax=Ostreococcus tauri TaxID=70448 RepID=Q00ZF1_OSTTA|nr:unnamed product [Ostreococcus tauri]OUS43508.1 hypothetical protein BE221DRAFT_79969 [Ostreococcus tauri]CAL55608.1 unnamed product [Ostreococcus tauri]|eukprot:XP_003081805.1 unnamed product [Ostreococcus tauri]
MPASDERREPGEVNANENDADRASTTATKSFDVLAKSLSLAAEARSAGERQRSNAILEGVLKQYVADLDEMRAKFERQRESLNDGGDGDAMDTS